MEQPGSGANTHERTDEQQERLVEALKISTVHTDNSVLERIADALHEKGLISGFSIVPIRAGYFHHGARVTEDQYMLNILTDPAATAEARSEIRGMIESHIKKDWETPAIEEEMVTINESLFEFIKRVDVEHTNFKRERSLRRVLAASLVASLMTITGGFVKWYSDQREAEGRIAAFSEHYDRLGKLDSELGMKIQRLEAKIQMEEPLTVKPSDMAAQDSYEETQGLLDAVRDVEREVKVLLDAQKKDQ